MNYAQSFLNGYNQAAQLIGRAEDKKHKSVLQKYQLEDLEYKKNRRDVDDKHTDWTREKTKDEYNKKQQVKQAQQNLNAYITGLKSGNDELSFELFKKSLPQQETIKNGVNGYLNNEVSADSEALGKFISNINIASSDKRLESGLSGNAPQMITVQQAEQQLGRKLNENELAKFENGVGFITTFNNKKGEVVPATVNKSSDNDDEIVIQNPSKLMNGVQSLYSLHNLTLDDWKQMSSEDKEKMSYILKADAISKGASFDSEVKSGRYKSSTNNLGEQVIFDSATGKIVDNKKTETNENNTGENKTQTPQDAFTQSISNYQEQIKNIDDSDISSNLKDKKIAQLQQQKIGKSLNTIKQIAKTDPQQADIYMQELEDSIITDYFDGKNDGDLGAFATPRQLKEISKIKQSLKDKLNNEKLDATPNELKLIKQYKEKYPDKTESEILNAMRKNNG